jgi:hypothetical protein
MNSRLLLLFCISSLCNIHAFAQANCSGTSVGFTPINDLGTGTYNGWTGGLYPNGSNYMPATHKNAGLALAAQVQPLNSSGAPDPASGKVVWLSIGFSNTTQEASAFIPLANALPNKNPKLVLVDGAVGGMSVDLISTPTNSNYSSYWNTVSNRLAASGLTASQVQVIWFKDDKPANGTPLQAHFDSVLAQSKRVMNELRTRFPNVKLCYVASRIYGGYASVPLNPEPYAYRNGWAMKKMIEDQINGDPQLQYAGTGSRAPWLSWGIYQWADGLNPRSDGLTWVCSDFQNDGTHPSPQGQQKVANLLLNFFRTDSTACPWFLSNCALTTGLPSFSETGDARVFPNPVSTEALVRFSAPVVKATLVLYSGLGTPVRVWSNISGREMRLNRAGLPTGIYYLKVTDRNKQIALQKLAVL